MHHYTPVMLRCISQSEIQSQYIPRRALHPNKKPSFRAVRSTVAEHAALHPN